MPVGLSRIYSNIDNPVSTLTVPGGLYNSGDALFTVTTQDQVGNTVSTMAGGGTSAAASFIDRITGATTVSEIWYLGISNGGNFDVTVTWSGVGKISMDVIALSGVGV
jgi:hypothetical protein